MFKKEDNSKIVIIAVSAVLFFAYFPYPGDTSYGSDCLRVQMDGSKRIQQSLPYNKEIAEVVLKDFRKNSKDANKFIIMGGGGTNIWIPKFAKNIDYAIKEATKSAEFKKRIELGSIAPDAFIPWLILDSDESLWLEELVFAHLGIYLDHCLYTLKSEAKIREVFKEWIKKYLYMIERGIKCTTDMSLSMSDFGVMEDISRSGFLDFGALERGKAPEEGKKNEEFAFYVELRKPVKSVEFDLESMDSSFLKIWDEVFSASMLGKNLTKQNWRNIWNTKPPENRFLAFRSKYLESKIAWQKALSNGKFLKRMRQKIKNMNKGMKNIFQIVAAREEFSEITEDLKSSISQVALHEVKDDIILIDWHLQAMMENAETQSMETAYEKLLSIEPGVKAMLGFDKEKIISMLERGMPVKLKEALEKDKIDLIYELELQFLQAALDGIKTGDLELSGIRDVIPDMIREFKEVKKIYKDTIRKLPLGKQRKDL
ncbi:hypothetical protein ACFL2G_05155 [Candidatus Omnitrophota bacterium]